MSKLICKNFPLKRFVVYGNQYYGLNVMVGISVTCYYGNQYYGLIVMAGISVACYYGNQYSGTRQIYASEAYRIISEIAIDEHQLEQHDLPPADGKIN